MAHQPNLFSSEPEDGSAIRDRPRPPANTGKIPIWLRRIELFFYVIVRVYVGVILLVFPWTPVWGTNSLVNYFPAVGAVLTHGAVRGIISGLGLLDLWIALDEAVHYREKHP